MRKHWAMLATLLCLAGGQEQAWADFVPLGDLPGGLFLSRASGVSADGSVVVGESVSASGFEAFRWTPGEDLLSLVDFYLLLLESFAATLWNSVERRWQASSDLLLVHHERVID